MKGTQGTRGMTEIERHSGTSMYQLFVKASVDVSLVIFEMHLCLLGENYSTQESLRGAWCSGGPSLWSAHVMYTFVQLQKPEFLNKVSTRN